MFLEQIGADTRVRELYRSHEAPGIELGRVCFAAREQYRLLLESGEREAVPAGRLRWSDTLPAVGDWVAARPVDPELALIEAVLPRRTQFSRQAAGRTVEEQVVAANVDLAVIVCGLDHDFNVRRLERYLVLAAESGARAVIVLNKADLSPAPEAQLREVQPIAPGVPVVTLSARESVAPLAPLVRGKTVAFLGSSGAGKSTIANALLGVKRQATAEVREADSRGRHTTTSRMLLPLPGGGALIDNPGMRELQLWAGGDSLESVFAEVSLFAGQCRFRDCGHESEPGCAVRAALENGSLDPSRWESYRKLQAEIRSQLTRQNASAAAAEKKKWRAIHRAMRLHPKYNR